MDPVTVVETALFAGAAAGAKDTASQAIKDAYATLKSLVSRRVKEQPGGEVAIAEHAGDPETWRAPLIKALTAVGVDRDEELIVAARRLLELVDPAGSTAGKYAINITTGDRSVVAGTIAGSVATGDQAR
jgi:hypothetical protein